LAAAELPFIDVHGVAVAATQRRAWESIREVVGGTFRGPRTELFARLLGASETRPRGDPGEPGSAVAGFVVTTAEPPGELVLEGEHRFSRYALILRIVPADDGTCRVSAETRAEFPGLHGRLYRAAVIGTRAHVVVVRRLLRAVRARAERLPA
jgi:Protein of unknown function (DUF2867)